MRDNVETLRKLLRSGYCIEAVESEQGCIETRLARDGERIVVKLHPRDAVNILRDPRPLS